MYSVNYVVVGAPRGRILSATAYFEEDRVIVLLRNIQKDCNIDVNCTLEAYACMQTLDENWELGKDMTDVSRSRRVILDAAISNISAGDTESAMLTDTSLAKYGTTPTVCYAV